MDIALSRAASLYAANWSNIHPGTILKAPGWSNATTFNMFYNKPLQQENNFGKNLLGVKFVIFFNLLLFF